MQPYHDLLRHILDTSIRKPSRPGIDTLSIFGYQMRFNLSEGFPILTTKKVNIDAIIHELLWFLRGDTNIKYLQDNGIHIWDQWADKEGNLGNVYGDQWRNWHTSKGSIDQISEVIWRIRDTPNSRRLIVSAWNVADLPNMALPPCHVMFQFYVDREAETLSCQLYQRSADVFIGVPFNIASYALLTMMVAQVTGYYPGDFIHTFGDAHLYVNHFEQAELQLSRKPYPLPRMELNTTIEDIFAFRREDFRLVNYQHHPFIKAPVAV